VSATREGSYFESFAVGETFVHRRGRTISQADNARWSLATLNTAQAHYNVESMKTYLDGQFDRPIVNAAIVIAVAVGLTSEDLSENIFADCGLDKIRFERPVFPDDTLRARSTILEHEGPPDEPRFGRLAYRIEVENQRQETVCTMVRTILVKRRSHWQSRDEAYVAASWPAVPR
jgi:itaconyl-CoA hydratase